MTEVAHRPEPTGTPVSRLAEGHSGRPLPPPPALHKVNAVNPEAKMPRSKGVTQGRGVKMKSGQAASKKLPDKGQVQKPFTGRVFYLDITSRLVAGKLEREIKELGGTVEGFLSKEITYLVTNKKEAKCASNIKYPFPMPSPEHPTGSGSSRPSARKGDGKDGAASKKPEKDDVSRGKSLLKKVIKEQEIFQKNSILANALNWGVQILHLDDARVIIESKRRYYKAKQADALNKPVGRRSGPRRPRAQKLKSPFLKVEDNSCLYRPLYLMSPLLRSFQSTVCKPVEKPAPDFAVNCPLPSPVPLDFPLPSPPSPVASLAVGGPLPSPVPSSLAVGGPFPSPVPVSRLAVGGPLPSPVPATPRLAVGGPLPSPVPATPRLAVGGPLPSPVPATPRLAVGGPLPSPVPAGSRLAVGGPLPSPVPAGPRLAVGGPLPSPVPAGSRLAVGGPLPSPVPATPRLAVGGTLPSPVPAGSRLAVGGPLPSPITATPRFAVGGPLPSPVPATPRFAVGGPLPSPVPATPRFAVRGPVPSPVPATPRFAVGGPLPSPVPATPRFAVGGPLLSPVPAGSSLAVGGPLPSPVPAGSSLAVGGPLPSPVPAGSSLAVGGPLPSPVPAGSSLAVGGPLPSTPAAAGCSPAPAAAAARKKIKIVVKRRLNKTWHGQEEGNNKLKEQKKRGYCECCLQKYDDLEAHLQSQTHKNYAQGPYYQDVDDIITNFEFDFVDWSKVKQESQRPGLYIPAGHLNKQDKVLPQQNNHISPKNNPVNNLEPGVTQGAESTTLQDAACALVCHSEPIFTIPCPPQSICSITCVTDSFSKAPSSQAITPSHENMSPTQPVEPVTISLVHTDCTQKDLDLRENSSKPLLDADLSIAAQNCVSEPENCCPGKRLKLDEPVIEVDNVSAAPPLVKVETCRDLERSSPLMQSDALSRLPHSSSPSKPHRKVKPPERTARGQEDPPSKSPCKVSVPLKDCRVDLSKNLLECIFQSSDVQSEFFGFSSNSLDVPKGDKEDPPSSDLLWALFSNSGSSASTFNGF